MDRPMPAVAAAAPTLEMNTVRALLGLAVCCVVLSHADADRLIWIKELLPYKGYLGAVGVNLILVACGWLAWTGAVRLHDGGHRVARFYAEFAARLLPLYVVALAVAIIVFPLLAHSYKQQIDLYSVLTHLLFLQGIGAEVSRAINPVLGPFSAIVAFCLAAPWLVRLSRSGLALLLGASLLSYLGWCVPGLPIAGVLQPAVLFGIGIAVACRPPAMPASLACGAFALWAMSAGGAFVAVTTLWAILLLALFAGLQQFGIWRRGPALVLVAVGTAAYSVYIWHYLLIDAVGIPLSRGPVTAQWLPARSIVFLVLLGLLAAASNALIERPGRRLVMAEAVRSRALLGRVWAPRSPRQRLAHAAAGITCAIVVPFLVLEGWARTRLFDSASYTNSEKLDVTMRSLRNARGAVVAAFGNSEVLYGFDPHSFQTRGRDRGCDLPAFNFGVEGFDPNHSLILLEHLPYATWAPNMKIALVGVSLFENVDPLPTTRASGFQCDRMAGTLQRSVYTSPLARDHGMADLCVSPDPGVLRPVNELLASASVGFRYRSEIRALILDAPTYFGRERRVRMSRVTDRGFYMAASMTPASHAFFINRWTDQLSREGEWTRPLDEAAWQANLAPGGVFDRIRKRVQAIGATPVFYAVPTNPVMASTVGREPVRERNSQRMRAWAEKHGIGFIDTGVPRDFDPLADFEDHRHTSAAGAAKASQLLADVLATSDIGRSACRR